MADDPLLRALGRRQREEPPTEAPMDATARETAEDVLRPFDPKEREVLLDGVMAKLGAGAAQESEPPVSLAARRGRGPIIAAIVAIAAAAVLWLAVRPSVPSTQMPEYSFTRVDGGTAVVRGADDTLATEVELRAGTAIDWVITPASTVNGAVAAAVLAERSEGPPTFARLPRARVSEQGAVRLEGPWEDHFALEPGRWTLSILIGPVDEVPRSLSEAQAAPEGRWRVATMRAVVFP